MAGKRFEVKTIKEAQDKSREVLKETDKFSEEAQKIVEDMEKVTKGLEGVLKGGISEEDNRKLEEILKDAKYTAEKEFENVNEKRETFLKQAEEWRDTFSEAMRNKEMDEKKLDEVFSKIKTPVVQKLVREAVASSRREKEDYRNMHEEMERETKEDRRIMEKQKSEKDVYKSINVKVG